MNKLVSICSILLLLLFTFAFINKENDISNGKIGDVKYSILDLQKFQEVNGKGWVLMKGQFIDGSDTSEVDKPSDLFKEIQLKQLPDARAMFIRGMNSKRNDLNQDPFLKENNRDDRKVGEFQPDQVGTHEHNYLYPSYHGRDDYEGGDNWNRVMLEDNEAAKRQTFDYKTSETRPRNISLYVYIKIND